MPTRRDFLTLSVGGVAGAAGLLAASGCGVFGGSSKNTADRFTLWYWNRSISDDLLSVAPKKVTGLGLNPQKIGGDYKSALLTTLAGRASVPDVVCINSDISTYFPDANQFVDLYQHGARSYQHLYLDWKWKQGVTPEGTMIGFPMDTGPTALIYRSDLFAKAGLPIDPDEVAAKASTWDAYLEMGQALKKKNPNTYLVANIGDVFTQMVAQGAHQYSDKGGRLIADRSHLRVAWDTAVKAKTLGLTARSADGSTDWNAGVTNGKIASVVNAVWEALIIKDAAASTSGKWRCAPAPGGAGNSGGSFMAVTKYCRDPGLALEFIAWLQSPANQTASYTDIDLFPSTPSSFAAASLKAPDKFFGGQRTIDIFGKAAEQVKPALLGPYDNLISGPFADELLNVESAGKDPDRAWDDALSQIEKQLKHAGVQ